MSFIQYLTASIAALFAAFQLPKGVSELTRWGLLLLAVVLAMWLTWSQMAYASEGDIPGLGPDYQTLFNLVFGVLASVVGWILNGVKSAITQLRTSDDALQQKVNDIHVLVAGSYVRRDELDQRLSRIEEKLDRLVK